MNLIKSQDYFSPTKVGSRCHIIGCGSVGSTVAENLVRLGVTNITLYDFDTVAEHNIANQMFFSSDIGKPKTEALFDILCKINPEVKSTIKICNDGWTESTRLNGYVFLCVDNIEVRKNIVKRNQFNQSIKAMFDFRTRLEDAQHYAADWSKPKEIINLLKSMDFSQDEAVKLTPVTACNIEMGVAPTVRLICNFGVVNFMNFILKEELKNTILVNTFTFDVEAF